MGKPEGTAAARAPEQLSVRAFVLRFAVAFLVLEAFVYLVLWSAPLFGPYAELNASWAAALLRPFLEGTRALGTHIVTPTFGIEVRPGCDSFQASAVLLAGMVAFPAPLARKVSGACVGLLLLQFLNLLRLVALLWTGVHHAALFERMHIEILPALFVGAALALLLGWALWAQRPAE